MFNKLNRCTLALMLLTSSMSFSALPTKVVDPNQLYGDDDIRNVVNNRMGNNPNIYIAPVNEINDSDSRGGYLPYKHIEKIEKLKAEIKA
ncbi:MAG TPA: hypothetical protein LFV66_00510 [Rickettsia endosymbiont of Bembidion lapponicum]|nr:hypothetical protein [Rickettsia endosymbiont of Bembidion lapponicum]